MTGIPAQASQPHSAPEMTEGSAADSAAANGARGQRWQRRGRPRHADKESHADMQQQLQALVPTHGTRRSGHQAGGGGSRGGVRKRELKPVYATVTHVRVAPDLWALIDWRRSRLIWLLSSPDAQQPPGESSPTATGGGEGTVSAQAFEDKAVSVCTGRASAFLYSPFPCSRPFPFVHLVRGVACMAAWQGSVSLSAV
jgi:hypothetical protein